MAQSTNTIRFSLRENRLRGLRAGKYAAVARAFRTIGEEELIADMAGRNASVSRQEIMAVLDLMTAVVAERLLAGDRVAAGLFNARVSIRGGFDSVDDEYKDGRHRVRVRLMAGAGLKRLVERKARVEKVRGRTPVPEIDALYDYETQSSNAVVSPGRTAEITGVNLDYDRTDKAQGVFFADSADALRRAEVVHKLDRSHAVFKVPALEAGTYRLIVRRGFGREVREGRLASAVTVN